MATVAGPLAGIEQVLVATLDDGVSPHQVTSLVRQVCAGGVLGPPTAISWPYPAPWAVGDRNGSGGADVVEMYLPLSELRNVYTARLAFATLREGTAEEDALLTTGGGPGDPPILLQVAEPVPLLAGAGLLALLLAVGAAGVLLARRAGTAALVVVALVVAAGVAWAALVLDGDPSDWQTMAARGQDPLDDAPPRVDITAAWAGIDGEVLFLRVDAGRNAPPVAIGDALATDESSPLGGDVLAANPTTADSDPDQDTLTVVAVNGAAAAVGSPTTLPSGAIVTVNDGGTFTYDPHGAYASLCPGGSATDSFTYTVSDGRGGTATATVTVTINGTENAGIDVEKLVNGQDADTPPGPTVFVGTTVQWTYVVTNTGAVRLTAVTVVDNRGVTVTCPKTALDPGESMTCTGSAAATAGQYANVGTVTGRTPCAVIVSDTDPAHYLGVQSAIALEKRTNGQDADTPPGPTITVGSTVQWTYVATNTGDVALANVTVVDDRGVAVTCPKTVLQAGESMTCTGSGAAVAGQYANIGTATGTPAGGSAVSASDPSHYFGIRPAIGLEKLTNGEDADTPPGPTLTLGGPVLWTYVATNTGDVALANITVTDNRGVAVTCPKTVLQSGESMTCTGSGTATTGQYSNIGTASGTPAGGSTVTASDSSHYLVPQGCVPSYWKNHTDSWPATGYSPSQKVNTAFTNVATYYSTLGNATLLEALSFAGGPGSQGAAEILLHAGVAALLNAAHPNVAYSRTVASVIADVNAALLQDRDAMLNLAAALDADNNRGCPLT